LQHLQSRTCGTPDDDTPCRQEPHGSVTQPNIAVVRAKVRNDTFLFQKIGQYEAAPPQRDSVSAHPVVGDRQGRANLPQIGYVSDPIG
jgi:hypothetical protein